MAIEFDDRDALDGPEVTASMNITPLIDVLLVLLVMVIITIPVPLHTVNMALPVGLPPATPETPRVIRIEVSATRELLWDGALLTGQDVLRTRLRRAAQQPTPPEIHIQPHPLAPYDTVAAVLSAAQSAGLQKVGMVGLEAYAP